ncbi:MAG: DUF1326 domain-containing protein [Actinomycetota bacterium]
MSWRMSGTYYSACSCKVGCPCLFGEMEGDEGWCSGTLAFRIDQGNADGTDIGGTRVALSADWPSGFLAGEGTARLIFDPALSDEQRSALEAVFSGQKGGVFEAVGSLVSSWMPAMEAPIEIEGDDDETRVRVGEHSTLMVKTLRGPSGEATRVLHAAAAFRDDTVLADGRGSTSSLPDMKAWESGGHAETADFEWEA